VLRFGVQAFQQDISLDGYVALWRRAEELGLEWASVYDHFLPVFAEPTGPCFEGPTLLAAVASRTQSIRCGVLVAGNTYRHPAVLANVAATLDHVSHGRLELGLGAGWFELEHAQYGIPFPPVGERLARLREAARMLRSLWTEEETTFDGRYYRLARARCEPKPVQRPHPPLWIGGTGERVLLRIVAECADGWNSLPVPVEDYERLGRALARHCAELGRDPDPPLARLPGRPRGDRGRGRRAGARAGGRAGPRSRRVARAGSCRADGRAVRRAARTLRPPGRQ
jgi:F420-dependent oxidoreductase-like protein